MSGNATQIHTRGKYHLPEFDTYYMRTHELIEHNKRVMRDIEDTNRHLKRGRDAEMEKETSVIVRDALKYTHAEPGGVTRREAEKRAEEVRRYYTGQ